MHNGERQKRGVLFFVCFSGSMKMFATFFPGSFSYAMVKYNHRKGKARTAIIVPYYGADAGSNPAVIK